VHEHDRRPAAALPDRHPHHAVSRSAHGSGPGSPPVGAISSLLGVAGGEFIIPILIFIFGADIRTAGTASVLISIPVVFTGVARHWLTGHYRSQSLLVYLVLPMAIGSGIGAMVGGYMAAWAPTAALRIVLAAILAVSAVKLWTKSDAH